MPETQNILPVGTVVSVPEKKGMLFRITRILQPPGQYVIERCLDSPGHPLAGDSVTYRYGIDSTDRMTVVRMGDASKRLSELDPASCPGCIIEMYRHIGDSLSKENLTCDGKLPRSEVAARLSRLLALKNALDAYVGHPVILDC